jgi:hypothetical protein
VGRGKFLIPVAVALALVGGRASAATPAPDAGRYAPEVRLPAGEVLFPVTPEGFIAHSDLLWYGCGKAALGIQTDVDPGRLGARAGDPYRSPAYWRPRGTKPRTGCPAGDAPLEQTTTFAAPDWTRPYGGRTAVTPRPTALLAYPSNGFALDLHDEFRPGNHDLDRVPVTYERGRTAHGSFITYWLFYAYNSKNDDRHEGDWERISVRFDRAAAPKQVAYYAHSGSPRICAWGAVKRVGKRHPVIFSALGSHASYPRRGEFSVGSGGGVDDAPGGGARWQTWRSGVRSADQPWYGFGGAWGERGDSSTTTGPAGPGQRTAADWGRHGLKTCDRP